MADLPVLFRLLLQLLLISLDLLQMNMRREGNHYDSDNGECGLEDFVCVEDRNDLDKNSCVCEDNNCHCTNVCQCDCVFEREFASLCDSNQQSVCCIDYLM